MADPNFFLNAQGKMNMEIDDKETSDEESSDDDNQESFVASALVDETNQKDEANEKITTSNVSWNNNQVNSDGSDMETEDEDSSSAEADEEDTAISVAVPVGDDKCIITNEELKSTSTETNTSSTIIIEPSMSAITSSKKSLDKVSAKVSNQKIDGNLSLSVNGTSSLPKKSGLPLSTTKKRGSTPSLSLLKRRKLPLSSKRKLPTSRSPTISMFKQNDKDNDGGHDQRSKVVDQLTDSKEQKGENATIQETESGRSPSEKRPSPSNKIKKFKPSMARPSLLSPSIVSEKRILLHAGPAEDLPAGWTIKHYKRTTGLKHTDRYWFSPLLKKKFRSMAQVGRFLEFLSDEGTNGDEAKAWELFRTSPPGPAEIRSRNRGNNESGGKKRKSNSFGILGDGDHLMDNGSGGRDLNLPKRRGGSGIPRPWKLPLISSPGLYVVPPPSILHRYQKQQEIQQKEKGNNKSIATNQEEIEENYGPKIEFNSQGYITPSLLFTHALDAAGYTKEKLAEAKYFGSSIIRSADDMFNSNLMVDNIELIPKEIWERTAVDPNDDKEDADSVNAHKPTARELLMDNLHDIIAKSTDSQKHVFQFDDMIPKSLTIETIQSKQQKGYVQKVRDREKILKTFHSHKRANEDAMDVYESAMDYWSRKREYHEREKDRRQAKEAFTEKKEEGETAAKKKQVENTDEKKAREGDEEEKKNDPVEGVNGEGSNSNETDDTGLQKELPNPNTKDPDTKDEKADVSVEVKDRKEDELRGPGPEPLRPTLLPLQEIPVIPNPPSLFVENDRDDLGSGFELSNKKQSSVQEENRFLVEHLDPASFYEGGRYLGLLSNEIADPQFIGPIAPGIVGLNNQNGINLSTAKNPSAETIRGADGSTNVADAMKQKGSSKNSKENSKNTTSLSKNSTKTKTKKRSLPGPLPTSTMAELKQIMEKNDSVADALRDSIIKAAVYASRAGVRNGVFVGSTGESYPDICKAFSNHANCRPCLRCKNNKQGAYHCRLKRRHKEQDYDGRNSYIILDPLLQAPLETLLLEKK